MLLRTATLLRVDKLLYLRTSEHSPALEVLDLFGPYRIKESVFLFLLSETKTMGRRITPLATALLLLLVPSVFGEVSPATITTVRKFSSTPIPASGISSARDSPIQPIDPSFHGIRLLRRIQDAGGGAVTSLYEELCGQEDSSPATVLYEGLGNVRDPLCSCTAEDGEEAISCVNIAEELCDNFRCTVLYQHVWRFNGPEFVSLDTCIRCTRGECRFFDDFCVTVYYRGNESPENCELGFWNSLDSETCPSCQLCLDVTGRRGVNIDRCFDEQNDALREQDISTPEISFGCMSGRHAVLNPFGATIPDEESEDSPLSPGLILVFIGCMATIVAIVCGGTYYAFAWRPRHRLRSTSNEEVQISSGSKGHSGSSRNEVPSQLVLEETKMRELSGEQNILFDRSVLLHHSDDVAVQENLSLPSSTNDEEDL